MVHSLYINITYLYKQFDISARMPCHHQTVRKTHKSTFLKDSIHKPEFSWVHIVSDYGSGMTDLTFTMFCFCEEYESVKTLANVSTAR
jgi:hypothetical protein